MNGMGVRNKRVEVWNFKKLNVTNELDEFEK